jgi:hypothetical protein
LVSLAEIARHRGDLDQARALLHAAQQRVPQSAVYGPLAEVALLAGDTEQAQRWVVEDRRQAQGKDRARASALRRQSRLAWLQGDLVTAQSYLEESLQLADEGGFRADLPLILRMRGELAFAQGDNSAADWLYEGLQLAGTQGNLIEAAHLLADLAAIAAAGQETLPAKQLAEAATALRAVLGLAPSVAVAPIAATAEPVPAAATAIAWISKFLQAARERQDPRELAVGLILYGQVALHANEYGTALARFHEAHTLYNRLAIPRGVVETLSILAQTHEALGDTTGAAALRSQAKN